MAPKQQLAPHGGSVAGTGGSPNGQQAGPGDLFGVPMYSTQPRLVVDNGNQAVGANAVQNSQTPLATTKLDQLDIVRGWKLYLSGTDVWTKGAGQTLTVSPFYPANKVQAITFKLQAAYNTFNLTGPLAAIRQAIRPSWGYKAMSMTNPDPFANPVNATPPNLVGGNTLAPLAIDIPGAFYFDEYYDLSPTGQPTHKVYDALVTPYFMAAQARVVTPNVVLSPGITSSDLLGGPVTKATADITSTYTETAGALTIYRDAYWTATNPAANPPNYPWLYTNDYFTQPTQGQGTVGCLIQNTGVSVGQVCAIYGFVWDPDANGGLGAVVPMSSIAQFTLLTGGSLQNIAVVPQVLTDRMRAMYGPAVVKDLPSGVFVFDFIMNEEGGYFSNDNAINTYLVNGVQLNIQFNASTVPGARSTVYLGIEALKLATS